MKIPFDLFMQQLKETNATLCSLTNFEKVSDNVRKIALKLSQLNYLLGKENLRQAIEDVFNENPKAFEVLDILVAVRKSDKKKVVDDDLNTYLLESYFTSASGVEEFVNETGLAQVFTSKQISNLVDYVFGIEVGLDTNARKNRGGDIMENTVARIFVDAGIKYEKEITSSTFSELKECLGKDLKRFDFVVRTSAKTYLIETNFYNGGGSKPNEVARAYSEIAPRVNACSKYEFVWITDGIGWKTARNKLEEAYKIIPSIYNLTSIQAFIDKLKKEQR